MARFQQLIAKPIQIQHSIGPGTMYHTCHTSPTVGVIQIRCGECLSHTISSWSNYRCLREMTEGIPEGGILSMDPTLPQAPTYNHCNLSLLKHLTYIGFQVLTLYESKSLQAHLGLAHALYILGWIHLKLMYSWACILSTNFFGGKIGIPGPVEVAIQMGLLHNQYSLIVVDHAALGHLPSTLTGQGWIGINHLFRGSDDRVAGDLAQVWLPQH